MPVDLSISKHVIESFLAGSALREKREQRIAEAEAQREALEVRRQQIADLASQFQQRHKLETEKALSTFELNKARIKDLTTRVKVAGINAASAASGKLTDANGNPVDIGKALGDEGLAGIVGQTPQQISNLKVREAGDITQAREVVLQPNRIGLAQVRGNIQAANQGKQQEFTAIENEKNRNLRISEGELNRSAIRENLNTRIAAGTSATRAEKQDLLNQSIEAHLPDIYTGQVALEDLPKGDIGVRIQNAAKARGDRIFKKSEIEKFNASPGLETFMDNVESYNLAIKEKRLNDARNIKNALQADLGLFGRNTKGERGNLSNQDIARIGELLPSFWTLNQKENDRRVNEIKNIYFNAHDQAFRGMKPEQRKAVEERWNIRSRPPETKTNKQGREVERVE